MSTGKRKANELDVVLLEDGHKAVILEVLEKPGVHRAYEVDIIDDDELYTVTDEMISKVLSKNSPLLDGWGGFFMPTNERGEGDAKNI